ncbi:hypothetical protein H6B10_14730, partial [Gemmiger formicilis]|nr:hypothetical protein [Gemmiger formicilis]
CVQSGDMLNFLIGTLLSMVSAFVITWVFSKSKRLNAELAVDSETAAA